MITLQLKIRGKVQGVFYRASAKKIAMEIGVTGWVKNTPEGDVEAVVTGENAQLQTFIAWCKEGPEGAIVSDVVVTEKETITFETFSIIRE